MNYSPTLPCQLLLHATLPETDSPRVGHGRDLRSTCRSPQNPPTLRHSSPHKSTPQKANNPTHPQTKVALAIFNEHMPQPNQLFVARDDVAVTAADLLSTRGLAAGFTEADLRLNCNIALAYMESWLRWVVGWMAFVTPRNLPSSPGLDPNPNPHPPEPAWPPCP